MRKLIGGDPDKDACLCWYRDNAATFLLAAKDKMARLALPCERNLHIDIRDIRRCLAKGFSSGRPA